MTITLNGTTGITNDGGYTGDGIVFADTTPANTLVTTTGGNVGIGVASPTGKLQVNRSTTGISATFSAIDGVYDTAFQVSHGATGVTLTNSNPYSGAYNNLIFANSGIGETARIDNGGNLLVGTTTNPDNNRLQVKRDSANAAVGIYAGTTGGLLNWYKNDSTYLASVTFSGSTVTYGTGSDYRLKENVKPISNALDKVAALRPVAFTWKDDGSYGESFIAHELQELYPTAVNGTKDAVDSEGKPRYQGVDTSKLVALLTAAIQEQQAIITALTARVEALEGTQP
jgi:hypothetical protein